MNAETPYSAEAEGAVLGAMMIENGLIHEARVTEEDFFLMSSREIFAAIRAIAATGSAVDLVTISEKLKTAPETAAVARKHAVETATTANYRHHEDLVRELSLKRDAFARCQSVLNNINSMSLDEVQEKLMLDFARGDVRHKRIRDVVMAVAEQAYKRQKLNRGGPLASLSGIPTGFTDLDRITDGLQEGWLVILGGDTGMGKSAIAGQVVRHAAGHFPAHVINIEMTAEKNVARMVADAADLKVYQIRKAMMRTEEWGRFDTELGRLGELPITFDDTSSHIRDIRQSVIKAARAGARLIVLDYLQLAHNPEAKTREREIASVTNELKRLAMRHRVCIVCLTSLNRALSQRTSKKPLLSDLRDSGQIEYDADVVLFLYRQFKYTEAEEDKGKAELIVAKGRDIGESTISLQWDDESARFRELEERY